MSTRNDRAVHVTIAPATGGPRVEIARYDRAGKWYYECDGKRRRISINEAVSYAAKDRPSVIWHEGKAGGQLFDAWVRKARRGGDPA